MTTNSNTFESARIKMSGPVRGADEAGHNTYMVERTSGPTLFGEYIEVTEGNENDFNIEIGRFGCLRNYNVGNPYPSAREHFSAEDCAGAEQLIRSFFSNPSVVMEMWKFMPQVRFLGKVRFRPNWIIQKTSSA